MSGPLNSAKAVEGTITAAVYNASTPAPADKQGVALQADNEGNLLVNIAVGTITGGNAAASPTGSAVPADADYLGVNIGGTLTGVTGLSVGSAKAPTIAIVDGSGNQVTSFGGAASNVASNKHIISAGSDNAANIKNAAGVLFGVHVYNNAAYPVYVKLYNKATTPTVGTDPVFKTIGIQAGTQRDVSITGGGLTMATGIGIGIVKGIADSDDTAVLANDCAVDVEYT